MAYNPNNPNGQTSSANSAPVVIANDQSAITVTGTVSANISGSISNTSFAATQPTAASLNATVVGTGTFAVQAAQSGSWTVGLSAGTNAIGSITNTSFIASQATAANLNATVVQYQGGTAVGSTNPLYVTLASSATGGDTTFHLVSAASTNAQLIASGQKKVTGWYIYNSNASARKLNFYNSAANPPVLNTTVLHSAIVIPGLAATNVSFPNGIDFSNGIGISTVTDLTDAGTTAVALNDLIINIYYK
jgi:hypothetical protein